MMRIRTEGKTERRMRRIQEISRFIEFFNNTKEMK